LEETKLRNEVKRLETLQAAHADEVNALMRQASGHELRATKSIPEYLGLLQNMQKEVDKHPVEKDAFPGVEVKDKLWSDREHALEAIKASVAETYGVRSTSKFKYRGIEFRLNAEGLLGVNIESPIGHMENYKDNELASPSGLLTRFANFIEKIPQRIKASEEEINKVASTAKALREQALLPFAKAGELDTSRADYRRIQKQLIAKGPEIPVHQKPMLEFALQQQRELLTRQGYGDTLKEYLGIKEQTKELDHQVLSSQQQAVARSEKPIQTRQLQHHVKEKKGKGFGIGF
jgi:hypothetical protein